MRRLAAPERPPRRSLVARLPLLLLALVLVAGGVGIMLAGPRPVQGARPNGAGLVIRHGDGRVVYVYVEFSEPEISGEDLLTRSGLSIAMQPYGGLGAAVCSLDNEGCPSSDCFCKSYATPSYYWHYFQLNPDGTWRNDPIGPTSRALHDGDVDGWSWTSGSGDLPATSIDEIARLNGVDRSAPEPTPSPTMPPLAPTPTPAPPAPTPTPMPAAPTATTASPAQTATPTPAAVATQAAASTATPSPTARPTEPPAVAATPPASPIARAVEVDPTAGVRPVVLASRDDSGGFTASSYLGFAAILAAIAGAGGWVIYRRRKAARR